MIFIKFFYYKRFSFSAHERDYYVFTSIIFELTSGENQTKDSKQAHTHALMQWPIRILVPYDRRYSNSACNDLRNMLFRRRSRITKVRFRTSGFLRRRHLERRCLLFAPVQHAGDETLRGVMGW